MNTAASIIDALHQAGATLVVEDGKARVRGVKISPELMEQVRANKAAILAEWTRRQEEQLDRYAEVPTGEVAMLGRDLTLGEAMRNAVVAYAFRQPRPVHAWVMGRINEYHALGVPLGDDEVAASVDLLCWQRNSTAKTALAWLDGIEACAADIQQKQHEGKL